MSKKNPIQEYRWELLCGLKSGSPFFRNQITKLNERICQNIRGPTAVNRVNYAGGGMLRLVNEGPRAWWSQLGHPGCRKRARVTILPNCDEPADDQ